MGAFLLANRNAIESAEVSSERLHDAMKLQGFDTATVLQAGCFDFYLYGKLLDGEKQLWSQDDKNFCACTGTLIYKGKTGEAALQALYYDFSPQALNYEELMGAFCVIICKNNSVYLFGDRVGVYKTYISQDKNLISSSFLAVAEASMETRMVNAHSVYEYVFQGAVNGSDTLFENVKVLNCDFIHEFGPDYKTHDTCSVYPEQQNAAQSTISNLVKDNVDVLNNYFGYIKDCFGDRVDTALSGGYDSRLTLALLQQKSIRPRVHVYGRNSDPDVIVAKTIDEGEHINLTHIDKNRYPEINTNEFTEITKNNFWIFDGYPPDGIFDNGSDLETRKERCSDGHLLLNGGGGEIYRNFYYLPNRKMKLKNFLWSFYSQFEKASCTNRFKEHEYFQQMAVKVKAALGIEKDVLSRKEVEMLYPLFRCRYWMGRNNCINNKLGYMLTPFIDLLSIRQAIHVPIAEKNFGRFEARLIRTVSPALAKYNSDYGHNFEGEPSVKHKLKDLATIFRPFWLRRYAYSIKSRIRNKINYSYWLSEPYLSKVLDTGFPYMKNYFFIDKINDESQFNRICTLEYMFQYFNPELSN